MTWTPRGPQWDRVNARRAEIQAWCRDYVPIEEIARRLGVKLNSLCAYSVALDLPPRSSAAARLLQSHPDLKHILLSEGPAAFRAAVSAVRAARKVQQAADRKSRKAAVLDEMRTAIASGDERNSCIRKARRDGATLEEIGSAVGITRERVRQICARSHPFGGSRSQRYELSELSHER